MFVVSLSGCILGFAGGSMQQSCGPVLPKGFHKIVTNPGIYRSLLLSHCLKVRDDGVLLQMLCQYVQSVIEHTITYNIYIYIYITCRTLLIFLNDIKKINHVRKNCVYIHNTLAAAADVSRPDGGAFVPRCVGDAILKVLGSWDMSDLWNRISMVSIT